MPIYYLKIQVGLPHPDPVVETASLASVESADVWLVQFSCHLWYPIFDDAANVLNHYEFRPSRCLGNSSNNPERSIRHVADYLMVRYTLSLPPDVINERKLSALQLESIVYARYLYSNFGWTLDIGSQKWRAKFANEFIFSQQHEQILPDGNRAGFLIGGLSLLLIGVKFTFLSGQVMELV